jgi:hypothetical protein
MAIGRTSGARREVKSLSRGEDTQGGSGAVFPSGTAREMSHHDPRI